MFRYQKESSERHIFGRKFIIRVCFFVVYMGLAPIYSHHINTQIIPKKTELFSSLFFKVCWFLLSFCLLLKTIFIDNRLQEKFIDLKQYGTQQYFARVSNCEYLSHKKKPAHSHINIYDILIKCTIYVQNWNVLLIDRYFFLEVERKKIILKSKFISRKIWWQFTIHSFTTHKTKSNFTWFENLKF